MQSPLVSNISYTLTSAAGCDSLVNLTVYIYHNVAHQVDTTVCASALPFTWHGHTFTAAGNHTVTLLTSHGADSVVTYHLSVINLSANVGNVTHITCYGASTGAATATVTGGQAPMTYAWTNASGANVSTTTSISNRPAGTYTFTVTDHLGCVATTTVTLNTLNSELAPGTIAADQQVCDGANAEPFTGTAASGGDNGAFQWQISTNGTDWTPAPGTTNAQNYTYPNPVSNDFSLRRAWVSQTCGTVYSNTVTVTFWPNSLDTITAEICLGNPYQENGFNITPDQTGQVGEYTFEQHYSSGFCDSAVVLLLTVNPLGATTIEDEVCEGAGYSGQGFWVSPMETVGVDSVSKTVNLQNVYGCDSVVTLRLSVIDTGLRIVSLTTDFCEDQSAELMVVTDMTNYVWSTGETAPTILVTAPGRYSVEASQGDCHNTAHFNVAGCQYEFLLPNVITPTNGDGLNDYFYIPEQYHKTMALFEIAIFNRWGEMVFYSTDKNFQWNGEYRGQIQPQTIYNYIINYTDTAGRPQRVVGSLTVL
jgi:gliding motility-associated-like protein